MKRFFVFIFCYCLVFRITAQEPLKKKAEDFKNIYNSGSYGELYAMLSEDFKTTLPEKEFLKFISTDIYSSFGTIEKAEFNSTENKNAFIYFFQKGKLLVNMKLAEDGAISYLEFLPYYDLPKRKRITYLSDNKKITALDSIVHKLCEAYIQSPENCGLSIGIYSKEQSYFYNYGEKKRDENVITTNETVFEIGSLSKVFCGVLLANAILEKKVNADDDIRQFLPLGNYQNLELRGAPVRLIHLANHTSGLPRIPDDIELQKDYDVNDPYKNYDRGMMFNYITRVELESEPGTRYNYSNSGMALLGIILEKVYGKSLEELIAEKISSPLKLKHTFIKSNSKESHSMANGYNAAGEPTCFWNMNDLCAAGGLKSSSGDMLNFLVASLNQTDPALTLATVPTFSAGNTLGMSWHIMKTRQGNTLTWHNGGTFGFSAFMGFVKEKNCAVIVLGNSGTVVDFISLGILKHLQK